MPLFDYTCINCALKQIDKLVSHSSQVVTCTSCGSICTKDISGHAKTASAWEVGKDNKVSVPTK